MSAEEVASATAPQTAPPRLPKRSHLALMLGVRFLVVSALLASSLFFDLRSGRELSASQCLVYFVVAGFFVLTLVYALWLRFGRLQDKILEIQLQAQVLLDVGLAAVLVYLTGGVESPFTFFFALPIVNTAISFPRRRALWMAGLSCVLLGAMFILESQGVLPLDLDGRIGELPDATRVVYLLALNYAVFFAIAWLSGSLGEQLRSTGRDLKAAEEDLVALMALNRDIVSSLRSGLMALDEEGRVSLVNPMAEDIIGCKAERVMEHPAVEILPPLETLLADRREKSREVLMRAEVLHCRPAGDELPIGLTLSPLFNADGSIGTLLHMQDLTELKAMEASVQKAERLATLGRMAAGIAHEIRNPLASISGSVQMLRQESEREGAEGRLMDIIVRETGRLDKLLGDFLAYTRPREPQRTSCRVDVLVRETVEMFRSRPAASELRLDLDVQEVTAPLDQNQFRQVIWNLLTNAAEAVNDRGRIWVKVERSEDGLGVAVRDDGPGVPEENAERIFEPFFTTKDLGTGLGLASVAQIAEAHGGSMELRHPADGGAEFIFRLPEVRS